ncbi:hypothetical protein [Clavibacter michiganensis]|uniref:hypothetical protein n=1 Tax=Clavibacter michiganensis TaxID=28447 RepID=UPI001BE05A83|nr:hypothetical protein [Clavibacter michiganensis]MBT1636864.1 hypothetical protein [Clavibacter michiganensis]
MNQHTTQEADDFAAWMDRKRRMFAQDAAYTARWDESLWRATWVAEKALEYRLDLNEGSYVLLPNVTIPEWLRKKLVGEVWQDFDTPAPMLGEVPCSLGNWFEWAEDHPAELTLAMSDSPGLPPTLDVEAVHRAWELAREHSAIPLLWVGLEPTRVPGAVVARLRGLYVVTRSGEPNVTPDIDRILGFRGAADPVHGFDPDEVRDKALWFDQDAFLSIAEASVVFWEWTTDFEGRSLT